MGEKATANSTEAITQYAYDAAGNLIRVTDPKGGETVMTYDAVNRLTSRTLPNGVTTTYSYNEVDQITSIVHTNQESMVLASYLYERNGIGEPSKITREDGSYRELTYDDSLRLTQETFYNANGNVQETISYTYDEAGNRTAHSDGDGNHSYTYDDGFQLTSITNGADTESYSHDVDGRLNEITREGETLNLEHNATDQLTLVTNATTGETVTYFYDGEGNRIGESNSSEVKQYLVAPSMGSGLSVQDLVTDDAGNVLANHVYMGTNPLMRLDGDGNAVYYLTDAMGSVIGLVDENGDSVAMFDYDGFGNIRGTVGNDTTGETIGGDYRFQSQWLESESGLYYFRARDYDAQTGRFLSRDPVDLIETEPESFNPYQFVYNNPLIYSDPTGLFTITELNGTINMQNSLSSIRRYAGHQAKEYVKEQIGETFGNVVNSLFNSFLPGIPKIDNILATLSRGGNLGDTVLEDLIIDNACEYFEGLPLLDHFRFHPKIPLNKEPFGGFTCAEKEMSRNPRIQRRQDSFQGSKPEFIFMTGEYKRKNPNSFLIGDIKLTQKAAYKDVAKSDKQWRSMAYYARDWQVLPFVSYLSLLEDIPGVNARGLTKVEHKKMAKEAQKENVILILGNLIDL